MLGHIKNQTRVLPLLTLKLRHVQNRTPIPQKQLPELKLGVLCPHVRSGYQRLYTTCSLVKLILMFVSLTRFSYTTKGLIPANTSRGHNVPPCCGNVVTGLKKFVCATWDWLKLLCLSLVYMYAMDSIWVHNTKEVNVYVTLTKFLYIIRNLKYLCLYCCYIDKSNLVNSYICIAGVGATPWFDEACTSMKLVKSLFPISILLIQRPPTTHLTTRSEFIHRK